jgi:glycosyltransferase involved in cell wall biosynthesis
LISKLISITPLTDTIPNILKNKTVYYNIGEFTPRKNIEQVIHCFCKKFKKQDNVCLLIKTNVQYNDESGLFIKYKLKTILDNYDIDNLPDIVFCFDKNLSDSEIQVIHELGDVYFTLNLGEGFGLVTYTAKQIGNKVICGKYGAEKEFLDPNIDILLDYTMQTNDHMKIQSKFYKNLKTPVYDNEHVIDKLQIFDKTIKPKFNI